MNKTSTDKIKSATAFLIWFRRYLTPDLQTQVRSHLERPYQLALKILDCCETDSPLTVSEIAQRAGVSPETARQVLLALKEGGVPFVESSSLRPYRGWQTVRAERSLLSTLTPNPSDPRSDAIVPVPTPASPCPPG